MGKQKPKFDPNAAYESVDVLDKPKFDPSKPFDPVKKKPEEEKENPSGKDSAVAAKPSGERLRAEKLLGGDQYDENATGTPEPINTLKTNKPTTSVQEGLPAPDKFQELDQTAKNIRIAQQEKEALKKEKYIQSIDNGINRPLDAIARVDQQFYGLPGDVLKTLGIGGAAIKRAVTGKGSPEDDILFKAGEKYKQFIKELAPDNPAYQEETQAQVATALGDLAALYATGGISRLGKASALATEKTVAQTLAKVSPEAATGAVQTGISEYQAAKQSGASDDVAFGAFIKNAAAGSVLERIPVQHFFKRLDDVSNGGLKNVLKRGFTGGAEEATTEVIQQMFSNTDAANTYDKTRKVLDGAGDAGGIGFGLGFVISALGGRLRKMKEEAKTPEEKAHIQESIDLVDEKAQQNPVTTPDPGITPASPRTEPRSEEEIKTLDNQINDSKIGEQIHSEVPQREEPVQTGIQTESGEKVSDGGNIQTPSQVLEDRDVHIENQGVDHVVNVISENVDELVKQRLNESEPEKNIVEPGPEVTSEPVDVEHRTEAPSDPDKGTEERQSRIAYTALGADFDATIKEGLEKDGLSYVPRTEAINEQQAFDYIDAFDKSGELDQAFTNVVNTSNGMKPDTRINIAASLLERLRSKERVADKADREIINKKILDLIRFQSKFATEGGQGVNANKRFNVVLHSDPRSLVTLEKMKVAEKLDEAVEPFKKAIPGITNDLNEFIKENIDEIIKNPDIKAKFRSAKQVQNEKKAKIKSFWDDKLLKDKGGKAYDASYLIAEKTYNGAIRLMKNLHLAGLETSAIIQRGIDYIKNNHSGAWNENEFRTDFSNLLSDHEKQEPKISNALIKGTLQEKIGDLAKKHYTEVNETKAKLKEKLVSELGLSGESAAKIAAEIEEKLDKLIAKQKDKLQAKIKAKGIKKVNTAKLQELVHQGVLTDEETKRILGASLGVQEITPEVEKKMSDLSEQVAASQKAAEIAKADFTKENYNKYIEQYRKADKAIKELNSMLGQKMSVEDHMITMIQGNLLTPFSLMVNVYANYALQPLRFLEYSMAAGMDNAYAELLNKNKVFYWKARQKGWIKGNMAGTKQGAYEVAHGPDSGELALKEIQKGFEPIRSWAKGVEKFKSKEYKKALSEFSYAAIGTAPETMFRLLNLGDKPLSTAASMAKAYELAESKGLTGKERDKFLAFPDAESDKLIKEAGEKATFQDKNIAADWIQAGVKLTEKIENPVLRGAVKVVVKSQIPYVKTPLNLLNTTLEYAVPPIAFIKGGIALSKGNRQEGMTLIARGMIGLMIGYVAKRMFENGLLSPSPDEEEKLRNAQYQEMPPEGINISGLQRMMSGGDPKTQKVVTWVSYQKMGVIGMALNIKADNLEKTRKSGEKETWENDAMNFFAITNIPATGKVILDQSFLHGTNTLLNALNEGGPKLDSWAVSTTNAISAIAIPNTMALASKATNTNLPDMKADGYFAKMEKQIKNRWFQGDKLSSKIDMWGNKIKQTPEGRNAFIYNFLDVTKYRDLRTDENGYKIFELWKESKDDDVIPSRPQMPTVNGEKLPMTDKEYEDYQISVGKNRRVLVDSMIENGSEDDEGNTVTWNEISVERRTKMLKHAYDAGLDNAKNSLLGNESVE